MTPKTPIALITGTLGSGKTTLLTRILQKADQRLAVLMNEFGEIAVDSRIIEADNLNIVELLGGCVCCELTGELEAAVKELLTKVAPDMIIVEATGVAEADALIYEVEDNLPQLRLDSVICIVDAFTSVAFPQIGYTGRTQIEAADVILLNKIDLVSPAQARSVEEHIRQYNRDAAFFKTIRCDIDNELLLGLSRKAKRLKAIHHHGAQYQTMSFKTKRLLDLNRFEAAVAGLPSEVFRAKGFIRISGKGLLFNWIAGRYDLEEFPTEKTEIVFIGRDLEAVKEEILTALHTCEA